MASAVRGNGTSYRVSYFQAQLSSKEANNAKHQTSEAGVKCVGHIELEVAVDRSYSDLGGFGGQPFIFLCSGIAISRLAPFCRVPRAWRF
jgi:hypothetical protein